MGRSFKRDRDDIYEGEYNEDSFRQKKERKLALRNARKQKEHSHEHFDDDEEPFAVQAVDMGKPYSRKY